MKKSILKTLVIIIAAAVTADAGAAGFALYQGGVKGVALGGAVMGRSVDASAVMYNPATMTDFTNTVITVGAIWESPSMDTEVNGRGNGKMDPGTFTIPHVYLVQPLAWDLVFGLGIYAEYGLGSKYNSNWDMAWNTTETTVEGIVFNPNLAYKVTDKWSVAVGVRMMYFDFDQKSRPIVGFVPGYGAVQGYNHIEGDNNFSDWGWSFSSKYDVLDNFSVGVQYKSYIDTRVRGDQHLNALGNKINGAAAGDIRLPQSVAAGFNWDIAEDWHFGGAVTWTDWGSIQDLTFKLPTGNKTVPLSWSETLRYSVGLGWDITDNVMLMASYVYDKCPCSTSINEGSTMLPAGDRNIFSFGAAYTWRNIEFSAMYGIVLMAGESQKYTDEIGRPYTFNTDNGVSHQFGFSVTYRF